MELGALAENAIIYVLIGWVITIVSAKALRLDKRGVELKPYSLVYKNYSVQSVLTRILGRTRRAVRVFADVSVVAGFAMMGFAFWFLLNNVTKYFVEPTGFAELTVLVPGVTLTSAYAIAAFLLSLPIVLVMHEGAHGIVAALEKIKVKSGGFAVFIAVFAGFVEPDEEEFEKARKVSKLRVIGAGATSNVIFAMALGALLLTNPVFATVLTGPGLSDVVPEEFVAFFYEKPDAGVQVLSVMDGFGAQAAGMQVGDVLLEIDGSPIVTGVDVAAIMLEPGQVVDVVVMRGGEQIPLRIEAMPAPDDPEKGLMGITRDNAFYKPVYGFITWDPMVSVFLLWLWMISFFIGIINMLPLPILDGGKFIHSLISDKISEARVNGIMWGIYAFTFALFGLNIGLSYLKSGWISI